MFSMLTHVVNPVRDTNSEPGLPVVLPLMAAILIFTCIKGAGVGD